MGLLTRKLPLPFRMQDLVVPEDVRLELEIMAAWVRHRHKVLDTWGFAKTVQVPDGLFAVFTGSPGTGKTMAAQCLASELGLNLIRVDLSFTGSRYIGETEKSLGAVFGEAAEGDAILLFDETDAIFARRRDVFSSETGHGVELGELLDRVESHDGLVIFSGRNEQAMDAAFRGRTNFILHFPMPDEQSRLWIWEGMFPAEAERAPDLDLALLARRYEISGEQIRNAVLAAAFLAAAADGPISMDHLRRALRRGAKGRS